MGMGMGTATGTGTRNDNGALLLGGEVSPYHRESPWKRCWKLMKDGDLWGSFQKAVAAKNPEAVKLTKVKGHATSEMVQQGAVRFDDEHGNDLADIAAEKGATHTDTEHGARGASAFGHHLGVCLKSVFIPHPTPR